ncbi:hypothetical protein [Devosia riboflavina]
MSHQRFSRSAFRYYPSDKDGEFFVTIPETPMPLNPNADFEVLRRRNTITVTPFALQQTEQAALERLGKLSLSPAGQS